MKRPDGEVQLNIDLPADVARDIGAYCSLHHVPKKAVVQLALLAFLNNEKERERLQRPAVV